jgi:hypothetical protein
MVQDHLDFQRVVKGRFRERRGAPDFLDSLADDVEGDKRAAMLRARAKAIANGSSVSYSGQVADVLRHSDGDADSELESLAKVEDAKETLQIRRVVSSTMSSLDLDSTSRSYLNLCAPPVQSVPVVTSRRLAVKSSAANSGPAYTTKGFVFGREAFLRRNTNTGSSQ